MRLTPLPHAQDSPTTGSDPAPDVNCAAPGKPVTAEQKGCWGVKLFARGDQPVCSTAESWTQVWTTAQSHCVYHVGPATSATLLALRENLEHLAAWKHLISEGQGPAVVTVRPESKNFELNTWGSSCTISCCLSFPRLLPNFRPRLLLASDPSLWSLSLVWALEDLQGQKWDGLHSGPSMGVAPHNVFLSPLNSIPSSHIFPLSLSKKMRLRGKKRWDGEKTFRSNLTIKIRGHHHLPSEQTALYYFWLCRLLNLKLVKRKQGVLLFLSPLLKQIVTFSEENLRWSELPLLSISSNSAAIVTVLTMINIGNIRKSCYYYSKLGFAWINFYAWLLRCKRVPELLIVTFLLWR